MNHKNKINTLNYNSTYGLKLYDRIESIDFRITQYCSISFTIHNIPKFGAEKAFDGCKSDEDACQFDTTVKISFKFKRKK